MALEQGFVAGYLAGDGTNELFVSIGFIPSAIMMLDVNANAMAFAFTGNVTNDVARDGTADSLASTASSGVSIVNAGASATDVPANPYAGGDKLTYDLVNTQWELDGAAGSVDAIYVDEGGRPYANRVITKDPVDGAFVFTTPGFSIPAASLMNVASGEVFFIAFR